VSGDVGGIADLEKLAAELDGEAFKATLMTVAGRRPCIRVVNREAVMLGEYIYAAAAGDQQWWFWFGWAERIAPVADVAAAARKIERVLHAVGTR